MAKNQKNLDRSRHYNHHDHHSPHQVANVGRTHLALFRKAEKIVSLYYDTMREKRTFTVELLNSQLFCKQMNKTKERETGVLGLAMEAADSDTGNVSSDGATKSRV